MALSSRVFASSHFDRSEASRSTRTQRPPFPRRNGFCSATTLGKRRPVQGIHRLRARARVPARSRHPHRRRRADHRCRPTRPRPADPEKRRRHRSCNDRVIASTYLLCTVGDSRPHRELGAEDAEYKGARPAVAKALAGESVSPPKLRRSEGGRARNPSASTAQPPRPPR